VRINGPCSDTIINLCQLPPSLIHCVWRLYVKCVISTCVRNGTDTKARDLTFCQKPSAGCMVGADNEALVELCVVGIATRYGLDSPGIESRWGGGEGGEIYRNRPDQPCCPPSLLYSRYWVSFPRVKRPGLDVDHPPPNAEMVPKIPNCHYVLLM
jgi:hypothetical protein